MWNVYFYFLYRTNPSDTRGGYYEGSCSKRRRKEGAVSAAERCALIYTRSSSVEQSLCTLGAKRKMYLGWQSSNKGSDIRARVVPVTFPPLSRCSSIRHLVPSYRPSHPALSRDISSANTRFRTVKGLTSQHDSPRASAPALVTSKVHDVIP